VARVGGHDEIVTPDAGVLISHGDKELQEYVNAIRHLLSNRAEWGQMSKQCKALAVSKLSWAGMINKFLILLDEAHQLRVDHPRYPISPGFGLELASQSLECKRLGEAVDWLWNTKPDSPSTGAAAVTQLAFHFSQTWLGRIMIQNEFLKAVGKRILKRMTKPGAS